MGGFAVRSARVARPRVMAAAVVAAALLIGGACSGKEPPPPAVITATTVAGGAAISCPQEAEVVAAAAPIAAGTPVADAVATGALVRRSIPQKYRPGTAVFPDAVSGTITVPLPVNALVLEGGFAPDGAAPAVIAPPTSCAPVDDPPATVFVLREPVPAGTVLNTLLDNQVVVSAEIPLSFFPEGTLLSPDVPLTAVADLPANTIATSATFG
jgi:hypothetical protein